MSVADAASAAPTLSVVMPVYNEMKTLRAIVEAVRAVEIDKEIVLVDDGSKDGSRDLVQQLAQEFDNVRAVLHPQNMGKGAALRTGFEHTRGTYVVVQDADLEYDPQDYHLLLEPILQGHADVVYGSRFTRRSPQVHRTFHFLINRFLTLVSNLCSGLYLSDMETCYKVFRSEIIKPLCKSFRADRFGFEPEVTAAIAKLKLRVEEHPVSYFPRNYLEGKKITWKDGIAAVWFIIRCNLSRLDDRVMAEMPVKYHLKGRGRLL